MVKLVIRVIVLMIVSLAASAYTAESQTGRSLNGKVVRIEDLGTWTPHERLNEIWSLWVLPSGKMAYTLSMTQQRPAAWSRFGSIGNMKDVEPAAGFTDVEIAGMRADGTIVTREYSGGIGRVVVFLVDPSGATVLMYWEL